MADENSKPSTPDAAKDALVNPSPSADASKVPPRYQKSKRGRNIVIAVAVVALVVAGVFLWRYFSSYESTDDAQADVHLYPVSARVSGYVVKVNVNDNEG